MNRITYKITTSVVALVLAFVPTSASAQDVVFGGPSSALDTSSGTWAWTGSFMVALRGALEDTANFGPAAPVTQTIGTVEVGATDAATLSGIDVFVSSWWTDAQSAAHDANVVDWFLNGGDLLLLQDDSAHDGIGQLLGIPSSSSNGSASSGDAPLFEGPFGSGDGSIQTGNVGQLNPADIAANGGTIGGTNAAGQVTAAYWCPGDYAEGAGAMVILADVDMVSTWVDPSRYSPPNANGRLGLNSAAFFAQDTDEDGVGDACDDCPNSDLSPTVVIDGCDTGVENVVLANGCTISDLIAECAAGASNHGQFVSCVAHLTNDLKAQGIITGRQKGVIQRCAARADIP